MLTNKEYQRITDEYTKIKFKCKHCGRKTIIPAWVDKQMEFTENVKKLMKEVK